MKSFPCSVVLLLVTTAGVRAQAPAAPIPSVAASADADWAVVKSSFSPADPRPTTGGSAAFWAWGMRYVDHLLRCGETFFAQHPTDARRWTALEQMESKFTAWTAPRIVEEENKALDAAMDAPTRAAWQAKLDRWVAAAIAADDIPPALRMHFDSLAFARARSAADRAIATKTAPDFSAVKAELDRLAARHPDRDEIGSFAVAYVELKKRGGVSAADLEAEMRTLAQDPHPAIRAQMTAKLRVSAELSKPLELAFTAIDGRAVDLAKLRGKVVLVDFWATWCGPCVAELPNVKKVYAAYHDKGFEIVGISLDRAADRQKLIDFTAKEAMPWPQHFDGNYWKNEVAVRFAINAIPAMFLLDPDGRVVSTNARGPALEAEVKRLLKL